MKAIFGEIKYLKTSEKSALEKLASRRSAGPEVIQYDLAKTRPLS